MKTTENRPVFNFFFARSTFWSLLTLMLVAVGFLAYESMVRESTPDLEIPQALVLTAWPGAAPDLVETEVTEEIERRIKSLKGLKRYRSGSSNSFSFLSVEFEADAPLTDSIRRLRDRVNEAEGDFPKGVERPTIEVIRVTDFPILTFTVSGALENPEFIQSVKRLRERFEKIPGVKKANLNGLRERTVQIHLLPDRLRALRIYPEMVRERIKASNFDMPFGSFDERNFKADVKLQGKIQSLDTLKNLPVIYTDQGRVVRLKEIAKVKIDFVPEIVKSWSSRKGEPFQRTVAISLFKMPGKDTVRLIELAKQEMEEARNSSEWHHSMSYDIALDESKLINSKLKDVFDNCWQAMLAVFLILLLMLTWREALIAGLCIPVTFLGAIAVLWFFGYTLNELVIIGMVLALGLLVDDFILMMEGMHDGIFLKKHSPFQAMLYTLRSYAIPSFSGSLTTIIVFFPLMMIGGIDGKFIRLIPITAAVCLVLSYMVSIFIAVPMAAVLLKNEKLAEKESLIDRFNGVAMERLRLWLERFAIRNKKVAFLWCLGTCLLFGATFMASQLVPSELYPKGDSKKMGITIELSPNTDPKVIDDISRKVSEALRGKPFFNNVVNYTGMKSPLTTGSISEMLSETVSPHFIGFTCLFTPEEEREKKAFEYGEELRTTIDKIIKDIPGSQLTMAFESGNASNEDPIQIEILGNDMSQLRRIVNEVKEELNKQSGVVEVRDNLGAVKTSVKLIPRQEALSFYGLTLPEVANQIRSAMTIEKAGKYRIPGSSEEIDIQMGISWPSREGKLGGPKEWVELEQISLISQRGERIPAYSLLKSVVSQEPVAIIHKNGKRTITVLAKNHGRTVAEIINDFAPRLESMKESWPVGYDFNLAGEVESSEETYGNSMRTFAIGVFLVFAVMALLFGSYRQPFIVMLSLLFAMIGVFLGFFLSWMPFSFPAMVGIISLTGIVVNDAIVMVDTMNLHLKQGVSVKDAAAHGAVDRLRPIVSTTLTTLIGLTPLALSDAMWKPLCLAIIYGLLAATVFSLILIPCLFLLLTPEPPKDIESVRLPIAS